MPTARFPGTFIYHLTHLPRATKWRLGHDRRTHWHFSHVFQHAFVPQAPKKTTRQKIAVRFWTLPSELLRYAIGMSLAFPLRMPPPPTNLPLKRQRMQQRFRTKTSFHPDQLLCSRKYYAKTRYYAPLSDSHRHRCFEFLQLEKAPQLLRAIGQL